MHTTIHARNAAAVPTGAVSSCIVHSATESGDATSGNESLFCEVGSETAAYVTVLRQVASAGNANSDDVVLANTFSVVLESSHKTRLPFYNVVNKLCDLYNAMCGGSNVYPNGAVLLMDHPMKSNATTCSAPLPTAQAADAPSASSVNPNKNITVPIAEPGKLPVVPETVVEQEDILDLLEKEEGRWVSQEDFLDHNINAKRGTFAEKSLKTYRETRNVMWSKKNPAIGRDKAGNFLKRTGSNPKTYRYQYFLLRKFDKQ